MKTKDNEQYKKTDIKLKGALIGLIRENKREKVTVWDICMKCGINRSTFCVHFEDINALLDSLMTEVLTSSIFFNIPIQKEFLLMKFSQPII